VEICHLQPGGYRKISLPFGGMNIPLHSIGWNRHAAGGDGAWGDLVKPAFLFLSFDGQKVVQARWSTKYEKPALIPPARYPGDTEAQV
jgi:hypothetical protein